MYIKFAKIFDMFYNYNIYINHSYIFNNYFYFNISIGFPIICGQNELGNIIKFFMPKFNNEEQYASTSYI